MARTLDHEIPVPNRDVVPGYQVFGLAAALQLTDHWRLRTRIDNLTDRRYQVLIGFPAARRSLRLALGYTR